jgi:CheY-like chemotaxis protein
MTSILLVDDNKSVRDFIKGELEDEGFAVDVATDGREALEKLEVRQPDLIIMDVLMPRMSGLDALQGMRNRRIDVPVVFFTGRPELVQHACCAPEAVVEKGGDLSKLLSEVGRILRMKGPGVACD